MHRKTKVLALLCALTAFAPASAEAATLSVSTTGSDSGSCTSTAPCRSLARAYNVAAAGDVISVAAGTYARQDVPAGTKTVTFKGATGVVVRQMWAFSANATFDGINIDANGIRTPDGAALETGAPNITFKNAYVGNVTDEKGMLARSECSGCVIDNVHFRDVRIATDGIHNECLYSMAPNITIRNSRFTNCATMDVFFTRGTWWNQPTYGGFTLENNFFGKTYKLGGGVHYYSVYWGQTGSTHDRAVIRNNTFELPIGSDFSFTNSTESCNSPRVDAPGITHATCEAAPAPAPAPEPAPAPAPAPEPAPAPAPAPEPAPAPAPAPEPAPAPAPVPTSLVGAWSFDETSGTQVLDASGRGNHGTIYGAARSAGKTGQAVTFDGRDDFISVPDSASLDLTAGMTVEAWVYATATDAARSVVFKENRAAGHQAYSLYAANGVARPAAEVAIGARYSTLTSSQATPVGKWTHVAATHDGSKLRLYQNGVLVGTKTLSGKLTVTKDPLKIGGNAVWSEFFKGTIDDVRVFNVARTQAQVQGDMTTPVR